MTIVSITLSVLLLLSFGVLFTLAIRDLTPKAVLYRIFARVGRAPEGLKPKAADGPYKRIRHGSVAVHRPVLLNLETSEGSGQACHPDIAYRAAGFGREGWTYWMACTPYPFGNDAFENPEIFASHDGVNWVVPDGMRNPLAPRPPIPGDHNSDPDILFFEGELWLYYRETLRSTSPNENRIYQVKTRDGLHWSPRIEVLVDRSAREILAPTVLHDGARFMMWTVDVVDGCCQMMRRNSDNGTAWEQPTRCGISGLPKGRQPWHMDVLKENDRLSALLVSCTGLGGSEARLHYAYSMDAGLSWRAQDFLFDQVYDFESDMQYRGSLRLTQGDPAEYEMWYSARNQKQIFSVAYVRLVREADDLRPKRRAAERAYLQPGVAAPELVQTGITQS